VTGGLSPSASRWSDAERQRTAQLEHGRTPWSWLLEPRVNSLREGPDPQGIIETLGSGADKLAIEVPVILYESDSDRLAIRYLSLPPR
jgi:hypothetical protein